MSQSAILIAALIGLFVLYLAAKGRLSTYASVFFAPVQSGSSSSSGSSSTSSTVKTVADVAQVAAAVFA